MTSLPSGWYVVIDTQSIGSRITVSGDVHLILCDGKTLTASQGINVTGSNSLSIYAQSTGSNMGKLTATAEGGTAGIGGNNAQSNGTVIINGGNITARGSTEAAGIGGRNGTGGTITINGGIVDAKGGIYAAGIGGGHYVGGGNITITGGTVTATASNTGSGAAIGEGTSGQGATVKIISDAKERIFVKTGSNADSAVNISGSPFTASENNISSSMPGKKYAKIHVEPLPPVTYLDGNGTQQTCDNYRLFTNQTSLPSGWYVVESGATISDRITVNGDVHLILADGCALNAQQGIAVQLAVFIFTKAFYFPR